LFYHGLIPPSNIKYELQNVNKKHAYYYSDKAILQMNTALLVIAVTLLVGVSGHVPYLEKELIVRDYITGQLRPGYVLYPGEDFSFGNPFTDKLGFSVNVGRTVRSYLAPGDVDYFKFTLNNATTAFGTTQWGAWGTVRLFAYTQVPQCDEYVNWYPRVAVMGPGLDNKLQDIDIATLPFEIPVGYGIVVAENCAQYTQAAGGVRPSRFEQNAITNYWCPPQLDTCVLAPVPTCACSVNEVLGINGSNPNALPGVYYFVVWDPDFDPEHGNNGNGHGNNGNGNGNDDYEKEHSGDYTISIGLPEVSATTVPTDPCAANKQTTLVINIGGVVSHNAMVHRRCENLFPHPHGNELRGQ
jgi:hypothetical protein